MKRKPLVILVVVCMLVSGAVLGGKFAYDSFMRYMINKTFTAMKPELDAFIKQNQDTPSESVSAPSEEPIIAEENQTEAPAKATPKPKPKNDDIASIIDPKDYNRAIAIGSSVMSLDRFLTLLSLNTAEAKKEIKDAYSRLTPAQKQELQSIYNKYSKYLK